MTNIFPSHINWRFNIIVTPLKKAEQLIAHSYIAALLEEIWRLAKKLVEEVHISIAEVDNMGYTALNYARRAGHTAVADYLQSQSAGRCCDIL